MPRVPNVQTPIGPGIPGAAPSGGAPPSRFQARGQPPEASFGQGLQQLGELGQEISNQMFSQAMSEQKAKAETEAIRQLSELKQEAINSEDFRNAPEVFQQKARESIDQITEGLNPTIQDEVRQNITRRVISDTADLRSDAARKSQRSAIASFEAQQQTLAQEFATGNQSKRVQAQQELIEGTEELVQSGAITPGEAEQSRQEGLQNFHEQRVEALRNNGNLNEAKDFVDGSEFLSSNQKRILNEQIDNDLDQANQQIEAAGRKYASALSRGGGVAGDLTYNGFTPEQIKATLGPDNEVRQQIDRVEQASASVRQQVNQKTLEEQRNTLQDPQGMDATEFQMLASAFEEQQQAIQDGRALDYYEQQGVISNLPDLNPADPDPQALRKRAQAADQVASKVGQPVTPLKAAETEQFKQLIANADSRTVTGIFQSMKEGLGERHTKRLAGALLQEDGPRAVALYNAPDNPNVSEMIVSAQDEASDIDAKIDNEEKREGINDVFGRAFEGMESTQSAFVGAAIPIYKRMANREGTLDEFDDNLWEKALRMVSGGKPTALGNVQGGGAPEINNRNTSMPRAGVTGDDFRRGISGLNNNLIQQHGNGIPVKEPAGADEPEPLTSEELSNAQFIHRGDGKYSLTFPGNDGGVVTEGGRPFVIDMNGVLSDLGEQ